MAAFLCKGADNKLYNYSYMPRRRLAVQVEHFIWDFNATSGHMLVVVTRAKAIIMLK